MTDENKKLLTAAEQKSAVMQKSGDAAEWRSAEPKMPTGTKRGCRSCPCRCRSGATGSAPAGLRGLVVAAVHWRGCQPVALDCRRHPWRHLLEVQCRHCNHAELIDLTLAIWPRGNQVHTLKSALYCRRCMKEQGKKRRPDIVGLRERPGPDPVAPAAAKQRER
jgi:Pyruvate/2-oxoacid:ferredoxin oxidoreductase delta subunit